MATDQASERDRHLETTPIQKELETFAYSPRQNYSKHFVVALINSSLAYITKQRGCSSEENLRAVLVAYERRLCSTLMKNAVTRLFVFRSPCLSEHFPHQTRALNLSADG